MSNYRTDLEVRDVPSAPEGPDLSGSIFIRPTTGIEITTLEHAAGELEPLVTFDGRNHSRITLHFAGGPNAVEGLRDRLSEYLLLVAAADAARDTAREDRRREAEASEEEG